MEERETEHNFEWIRFSLKSILAILIGAVLFVWYVHALLYGPNSLSVLKQLQKDKTRLLMSSQALKLSNQKLQKKYFELIQLNSD